MAEALPSGLEGVSGHRGEEVLTPLLEIVEGGGLEEESSPPPLKKQLAVTGTLEYVGEALTPCERALARCGHQPRQLEKRRVERTCRLWLSRQRH